MEDCQIGEKEDIKLFWRAFAAYFACHWNDEAHGVGGLGSASLLHGTERMENRKHTSMLKMLEQNSIERINHSARADIRSNWCLHGT